MTDEMTLLVADYSALEVVILADITLRLFGDDNLAQAVAPGAPSIHSENARFVYGQHLGWTVPETFVVNGESMVCPYAGLRVDAIPTAELKEHPYGGYLYGNIKTVFYGWCYGKRGFGFSTLPDGRGGMIGEDAANNLVAGLVAARPGLGKFEAWVTEYVADHRGIYSLGGRWCDLSAEVDSGNEWQFRRAVRRGLNFPAQATGADIINDAMVRVASCPRLRALGFVITMQIHDELVLRGPLRHVEEAGRLLKQHMEAATANGNKLLIPLQVSVGHGPNYFEAK